MSKRYVTLYPGKQVSLGAYVNGWKKAKALPPETSCKDGPGSWAPTNVTDVLRALRHGMNDRINRHIDGYGNGRKWKYEYQLAAWRDSRRLRDISHRICVYQFETEEARKRFSHRLSSYND